MGLRFRKSMNLGAGFRVNLSKTGIGYSWGVKGARLTKTAAGRDRVTLSIPGTGISWVEESGGRRKRRAQPQNNNQVQINNSAVPDQTIENADVSVFAPAQYEKFLNKVRGFFIKELLWRLLTYAILFIVLLFVIDGYDVEERFNISAVALILYFIMVGVRRLFLTFARVKIYYEMDEDGEKQAELIDTLAGLMQDNDKIWQVNEIYSAADAKTNAGAKENVSLFKTRIEVKPPRFLKTNVDCYTINLKNENLCVLPDKLLIMKGSKVGSIAWEDMDIDVEAVNYITEKVPQDAEVIRTTWQNVNKDGSPDRRFAHNRQLAVCKYGKITFTSEQGFNTVIYVSDIDKAREFQRTLNAARSAD